MSELYFRFRPERDWKFNIGDNCVLNSGSSIMTVIGISKNGDRIVSWMHDDEEEEDKFPSICLRPHFSERILMQIRSL